MADTEAHIYDSLDEKQKLEMAEGIQQIPPFLKTMDDFIGLNVSRLVGEFDKETFDSAVDEIEAHLANRERFDLCGAECSMSWIHSDGVSVKEMVLSPMSIVTGAEHKVETINSVVQGDVIVFTETGANYFLAGDVFISSPGVRKLGITIDGVKFTNTFANPTNERDEEKLDQLYFESSKDHPELGEYEVFKKIAGVSQEAIDYYMNDQGEPEGIPCGSIDLGVSEIDGMGTFTTRDIEKGERFPVFMEGNRTILARYSNHSFKPNAWLVGNDATALEDISKGTEITMNYLDNYIKTNGNGGLQCLAQ